MSDLTPGAGAALPERDGIPPSRVWLTRGPWRTLHEFLCERFPRISPEVLRRRLEAGDIVDAHGVAQSPDAPYVSERWLWYYREVADEPDIPFDLPILYRDRRLLVVDKPHFMASTPGGRYLRHTALVRLRRELELPSLSPVHRLDRDTAGVLMFCVDPAFRGRYQSLFQSREVDKEYEALAVPPPSLSFPLVYQSRLEEVPGGFIMRETPGKANAETRVELLQWLPERGCAHLRLLPRTGRKHQLRAHMNALGMPILNDEYYPAMRLREDPADFSNPLQLLARSVVFRDPVDGQLRCFESRRSLELQPVGST